MTAEQILAVPRRTLRDALAELGPGLLTDDNLPQGFVPLDADQMASIEASIEALGSWVERARAEADPSLKQPIPYCAVRHGDAVFLAERLGAHGERRLHGRASLGFGGHVDAEDGPAPGALRRSLLRELNEELHLPADSPVPRPLGLINDDATEVGRVHFGLAYLLDLDATAAELRDQVQVREILKLAGGFRGLAESPAIWQDVPNLESWSAMLLDVIRPH